MVNLALCWLSKLTLPHIPIDDIDNATHNTVINRYMVNLVLSCLSKLTLPHIPIDNIDNATQNTIITGWHLLWTKQQLLVTSGNKFASLWYHKETKHPTNRQHRRNYNRQKYKRFCLLMITTIAERTKFRDIW